MFTSEDSQENIKKIFFDNKVLRRLMLDIPTINKDNPYMHYLLIVEYDKKGIITTDIISKEHYKKGQFIGKTRNLSNYRVFNMSTTKKSRVFDKYYFKELKYIESYSPHRHKEINQEINSVSGVIELHDITPLYSL